MTEVLKTKKRIAPERITSTRTALKRLKVLVQSRIVKLEDEAKQMGDEEEKPMNAAHVLVRTLEKVLELEERDRKQRALSARAKSALHEQWREELAGRIARLEQRADSHTHAD